MNKWIYISVVVIVLAAIYVASKTRNKVSVGNIKTTIGDSIALTDGDNITAGGGTAS